MFNMVCVDSTNIKKFAGRDAYGEVIYTDIVGVKCRVNKKTKQIKIQGKQEFTVSSAVILYPQFYEFNLNDAIEVDGEVFKILRVEPIRDITKTIGVRVYV